MKLAKSLRLVLTLVSSFAMVGCGGSGTSTQTDDDPNSVANIIKQAEQMDKDDLYKKAMEEIKGKTFNVVANSSRTPKAATEWIAYCQEKFDKDFTFDCQSTQPKNNQIFTQIKSDVTGTQHNLSMTLIQDGSQIASKMTATGYLLNYIPKEWDGDKATDGTPFALQSLNKVFCYNTNGEDGTLGGNAGAYKNCWDFADGTVKTQFMAPKSEPVGQNFLYMLTKSEYAAYVKEGYDALDADRKAAIDAVIADSNSGIEGMYKDLGATDTNVKYSLAWIYDFLKNYTAVSDDGPIATNLTQKTSGGAAGLLVYSKFRSTEETDATSNKWMQVAAYQSDYKGFGGYMYKHYLQVLSTSPYPWTSCALINFMTTTVEGFSPWGKDMGGYSSSKSVATGTEEKYHHQTAGNAEDGTVEYEIKNDKGYDWWTTSGKLVLEDGEYASKVAATMADWIAYL